MFKVCNLLFLFYRELQLREVLNVTRDFGLSNCVETVRDYGGTEARVNHDAFCIMIWPQSMRAWEWYLYENGLSRLISWWDRLERVRKHGHI